ncbi:hypothetical protein ACH5RR_032376 [Cinchona calisaya]|uniref:RNase H type-1 domain-containing protein n=1 Tax=Cinchona calisaya TaxID=153742 RepID=A0ABD2YM09_9GENT
MRLHRLSALIIVAVLWRPTKVANVRLNVDGASKRNLGEAAGGRIIKDTTGSTIKAFSNYYGHQNNLQAEVLALLDGLKLCLNLQLHLVEVEMDSLLLVRILQGSRLAPWSVDHRIQSISSLKSIVSFFQSCI